MATFAITFHTKLRCDVVEEMLRANCARPFLFRYDAARPSKLTGRARVQLSFRTRGDRDLFCNALRAADPHALQRLDKQVAQRRKLTSLLDLGLR